MNGSGDKPEYHHANSPGVVRMVKLHKYATLTNVLGTDKVDKPFPKEGHWQLGVPR